jgi:hypothetical protein
MGWRAKDYEKSECRTLIVLIEAEKNGYKQGLFPTQYMAFDRKE